VIAFAPSAARPDALLTPVPPGQAYAADVARLNGREPVGPADDAWLALAHAVARAAALPAAQRPAVLASGADSLAALLPDALAPAARRTLLAAGEALHTVALGLGRAPAAVDRPPVRCVLDARATADALAALQQAVAEQEQAGAFLLAFSTLAALRLAAAPVLDARGEGLLLAQQGRVARQLGALTTAAELYASAVRAARAARAPDVAARALLGAGSLASMRGNYPEARTCFRSALRAAERAGDAELERAGHQGLLVAAFAADDIDTALAHGWAAVRGIEEDDAEARAVVLANLGEVGRQGGRAPRGTWRVPERARANGPAPHSATGPRYCGARGGAAR
jgi:tetratricopeptide (TPR) repeat protein